MGSTCVGCPVGATQHEFCWSSREEVTQLGSGGPENVVKTTERVLGGAEFGIQGGT